MEKDKLIGKRFGKLVVIKRVPNLNSKQSIENIQRWLTIQGTKTQVIDDKYVKDNIKMTFKCECGSIFKTNWNTMRFYKTFRCQKCTHKQSKNEKLTEEYLISLNVEYET